MLQELDPLDKLIVTSVVATTEEFMYDPGQHKEDTCANAKSAIDTVADLAEVCRNATAAYAIAEKKHKVRGVTMHLRYIIVSITFMPGLIPLVKVHHSGCDHACNADKHGENEC